MAFCSLMILVCQSFFCLMISIKCTYSQTSSDLNLNDEFGPKYRAVYKSQDDSYAVLTTTDLFVDKSRMIEDWLIEENKTLLAGNKILITYPRGFGKTTILKMFSAFFETRLPPNATSQVDYKTLPNYEIFKNLKISKNQAIMKEYLGRRPVLFVNFAIGADVKTFDEAIKRTATIISTSYCAHRYLYNSPELKREERKWCCKRCLYPGTFSSENGVIEAATNLAYYLKLHHKQKCVILVDEYDAIVVSALKNIADQKNLTQFNQIVSHVVSMLNALFINNTYVDRGVITGVLHVLRDYGSQFDTNIVSYRFMQNESLAQYYGFTESEFHRMMIKCNINQSLVHEAVKMYAGYEFAGMKFYNMHSVVLFLEFLPEPPQLYWARDETLVNIQNLLRVKTMERELKDLIFERKLITFEFLPRLNEQLIRELNSAIMSAKYECKADPKQVRKLHLSFLLEQGYFKVVSRTPVSHESPSEEVLVVDVANDEIRSKFKYEITINDYDYENDVLENENFHYTKRRTRKV